MPVPTSAPNGEQRRHLLRDAQGRLIGPAEMRRVPVTAIKVDHAYQRDVVSQWVHEHLPFDEEQAGAVVLSARAGGPYCIDGNHRVELARASGVALVNALVIDGLTQEAEARLFTRYQRERRNLTAHALYRADLVAGDPDTLVIVRIVHVAGFQITKGTVRWTAGTDHISAIDALRWIHRYGGEDLLARVLQTVRRLWFTEEKSASGQILKALALVFTSASDDPAFKVDIFERMLRENAPLKLIRLSESVAKRRNTATTGAANIAEAMVEQYNRRLAKGTPPLKLRIGGRQRPRPARAPAPAAEA